MALNHIGGNAQPSIDKEEHRYKNIGAKAVVLHGYDPTTDSYYPVNLTQNTDGTYSLSGGELVSYRDYDTIDVQQTSSTIETYVYKKAATTVRTVTVTYTDTTKDNIDTVVWS